MLVVEPHKRITVSIRKGKIEKKGEGKKVQG
jgi:hypothetical protein